MLFNSYPFIFGFLPVALVLYFLFARLSIGAAALWLAAASLFFYGWWNPAYLLLLLASILWNFTMGRVIQWRRGLAGAPHAKLAVILAVGGNLTLLGYYKYSAFFVESLGSLGGASWHLAAIVLPLGISFYTFTQIAYLVDVYRGEQARYPFPHYLLFISYFPHLLAGPILHHRDVMPQFANPRTFKPHTEMIVTGLMIFVMGLFKKVVLADGIAQYVAPGFEAARLGPIGFFDGWTVALAFTLQIYFDFSAYSDMAVGVSRMFGVRIPLNFNSPYQATNITEMWQRWHISLTSFLGDYLFVPMGGRKRSARRRMFALMATMLLAGLWHGAGWTFIAFGGLQGIYLLVHHNFRTMSRKAGHKRRNKPPLISVRNWALTFFFWTLSAVMFRADSLRTWWVVTKGMLGLNGITLPEYWQPKLGAVANVLGSIGVTFGQVSAPESIKGIVWIVPLLLIALFWPNTQRLMVSYMKDYRAADFAVPPVFKKLLFVPSKTWAVALGLCAALALLKMNRVSEFLYYQF